MKCWSSVQKYVEVQVETSTKELVRQDKLKEAQFKADLGNVLIENAEAIHVADVYLATGVIEVNGQALILPVTNK